MSTSSTMARGTFQMITLPGMRDRTVLVNVSKTYSVTGWRVGWVIAAPDLTDSIRKVHDFLTVGAPAPLQQAGAVAMALPDDYYAAFAREYRGRRDRMLAALEPAGFRCVTPRGAYYIMADISGVNLAKALLSDVVIVRHMIEKIGVAAVPRSSFLSNPADGKTLIRFCFSKNYETIEQAERRLSRL